MSLPQKANNLRFLIINCNSCLGKKAELDNLLNYTDADVVLMTETKIDNAISAQEFLPPHYKATTRKDRALGGGGVLIAVKDHLVVEQLSMGTNAEVAWAKLSLRGYQSLYVGVFYRQPKGPVSSEIQILEELNDSLHTVQDGNRRSQKTIILGGDFNAGGIDWNNNVVPPGAPNPSVSTRLLEILDDHNLTQVHREPTRETSILDLFCNRNIIIIICINRICVSKI